MKPTDILHPAQRKPSKAYLVNKLREVVYSGKKQRKLEKVIHEISHSYDKNHNAYIGNNYSQEPADIGKRPWELEYRDYEEG